MLLALSIAFTACGDDDEAGPATTAAPAELTEVRAYFLRDEQVGPVARPAEADATAAGALESLLAGPSTAEQEIGFGTAIPAGTTLLDVEIQDGIATVDLSEEFASGGGSASMMGRVAQVVFTLTQFPTVDAVLFELAGEPVTALGGEGLLVAMPQTRADWEELSPAILIESPLPFDEVTSPLRISGTANVFEAQFVVNVTDGEGLIVYDEPAMATSGSGTRGMFDITATFEVPRPGFGSVIAFDESARDGSQVDLVEVPIRVSA
jgi:hypothetical protein